MNISKKPTTKFMNAPATMMIMRFQTLALVKARGLSLFASSPSMAQKPPIGNSRSE